MQRLEGDTWIERRNDDGGVAQRWVVVGSEQRRQISSRGRQRMF